MLTIADVVGRHEKSGSTNSKRMLTVLPALPRSARQNKPETPKMSSMSRGRRNSSFPDFKIFLDCI